jgi:hypothetical protein
MQQELDTNNGLYAVAPTQHYSKIVEVIDIWTFACEIPSTKLNWMLIATDGE